MAQDWDSKDKNSELRRRAQSSFSQKAVDAVECRDFVSERSVSKSYRWRWDSPGFRSSKGVHGVCETMYSEGGPDMDKDVARMHSVVNEILGFVRGAGQEMEIGEVERKVLSMVMEVGREALIDFVTAKGTGYSGQEVVDSEGSRLPYVRDRERAYRSVFGTIKIKRAYYQAKGEDGFFPLDGALNLPERGYSYLLQEISSKLAMNASYEKACEVFGDIFPIEIPIRSLERVVGEQCEDAARYYEAKAPPDPPAKGVVTVATVDKKGVVMRNPPLEGADKSTDLVDGKKRGKKRMSTVTSAYNIERHVRTSDDVAGRLMRTRHRPGSLGPNANKCGALSPRAPKRR